MLMNLTSVITLEELRWQEANFKRCAELGRELLFLISNDDWVRATCETIAIGRSDKVETTVKVEVDFERITHEAFRDRLATPLWLPILILPPSDSDCRPDPLTSLIATDADGTLLATLPSADVHHRIAAALAEIIYDVAVSIRDDLNAADEDNSHGEVTADDSKYLLSAAIYRLLREGIKRDQRDQQVSPNPSDKQRKNADRKLRISGRWARHSRAPATDHRAPPACEPSQKYPNLSGERLINADDKLHGLLDQFFAELRRDPKHQSLAGVLAARATDVLRAFVVSAVIVIALRRQSTPAVLTVATPPRALRLEPVWRWAFGHPIRWLVAAGWSIIMPTARLDIPLLLASADADRKVQLNLSKGLYFAPSRWEGHPADIQIIARQKDSADCQPSALRQLDKALDQLDEALDQVDSVPEGREISRCLADLALVKLDATYAALRDHRIVSANEKNTDDLSMKFRGKLNDLRIKLDELISPSAGLRNTDSSHHGTENRPVLRDEGLLSSYDWSRTTTVNSVSPDVMVGQAHMVNDVSQRAAPTRAKLRTHVAVADVRPILEAGLTGFLSMLMITGVLLFLWLVYPHGGGVMSPEVVVFVLTLFAVVQAGRINWDSSIMPGGALATASLFPTIAVIGPTAALAIALAFVYRSPQESANWACICLGFQVLFESLLLFLAKARRWARQYDPDDTNVPKKLMPVGLRLLLTDSFDYAHSEVLHDAWLRGMTSTALRNGRPAYGYLVWQHGENSKLDGILSSCRPARKVSPLRSSVQSRLASVGLLSQPAHVLALLRAGTSRQSLNFVVFRDEPNLPCGIDDGIKRIDLNPGMLVPAESSSDIMSIYLGMEPESEFIAASVHPVTEALRICKDKSLFVREAQLPFPPPLAEQLNLTWARIQVSLRQNDIDRLGQFLCELRKWFAGRRLMIAVKAVYESTPRVILSMPKSVMSESVGVRPDAPAHRRVAGQLIYASDLDVVRAGGFTEDGQSSEPDWRVMAICADWHLGVNVDVLDKLSTRVGLAGLTTGMLQGTAVVFVLGRWLPNYRRRITRGLDENGLAEPGAAGNPRMTKYFDESLSAKDLGREERYPLLAIRMRTPDRAGAIVTVLESVREVFEEMNVGVENVPHHAAHDAAYNVAYALDEKWSDWYAKSVANDVGTVRLMVRLKVDPATMPPRNPIANWNHTDIAKFERLALARATRKINDARQVAERSEPDSDALANTVIKVQLLRYPGRVRKTAVAGQDQRSRSVLPATFTSTTLPPGAGRST